MKKTLRQRFEEKVRYEPRTGCLLWTAGTSEDGYGVMRAGGGLKYAHHVAWFLHFGEWPVQLNHYCDTPACCAIKHVRKGTQRENIRDCIARGRFSNNMTDLIRQKGQPMGAAAQKAKTHCPRGHAYEGVNLYIAKNGARKCHECRRILQKNNKVIGEAPCPPNSKT